MEKIQHIIKKAVAGHEKEQRMLYDEYRTRWYMLSLRYAKNSSQADDIFQEGLVQIFRDLHQFDITRSAFTTWSCRVLVNAALKYLKKHNWVNTLSDQEESNYYADESETIYDKLATKELTMLVQQLPLGYRIVFNMSVIEGYTHKEIAKELGISEGTSKSQLSKARRTLKKQLENLLITNSHE